MVLIIQVVLFFPAWKRTIKGDIDIVIIGISWLVAPLTLILTLVYSVSVFIFRLKEGGKNDSQQDVEEYEE